MKRYIVPVLCIRLSVAVLVVAMSPNGISVSLAQTGTKISELPPATTPLSGNEQVPVNQGGTTVRSTTALQTVYTLTSLQELTSFTPAGAWRYTFPGTATNPTIYLDSTLPRLDYVATGGLRYSERVDPTEYSINSCNAAGSVCNPALRVLGTIGGGVVAVTFGDDAGQVFTWDGSISPWVVSGDTGLPGQVLTSTGNATSPQWQAVVNPATSGTFTVTWSNACTTDETQNWKYTKVGGFVALTALENVSCTSDSTEFATAAGAISADLRPDIARSMFGVRAIDNSTGSPNAGCLLIEVDGTMRIRRTNTEFCGDLFTASGTKQFLVGPPFASAPSMFTYDIDLVP